MNRIIETWKRDIGKGFRALADLLMPRRCLVCDAKLEDEQLYLCPHCHSDMPLTRFWQLSHNPMADKLNELIQKELERRWNSSEGESGGEGIGEGDRSGMEQNLGSAAYCRPEPLARPDGIPCFETHRHSHSTHERYAYAASLFFFSESADYKRIPYSIKYGGALKAGKYFGNMLGEKLAEVPWFQAIDMIIPVPLHWRRERKRGYNQAKIIAEGISEAINVPVRTDILLRRRHTKTQVSLDIQDKSANVKGAFVATSASTGYVRHILLVDDVFTTGSTLFACFCALREVFPPEVRISVATLGYVGQA